MMLCATPFTCLPMLSYTSYVTHLKYSAPLVCIPTSNEREAARKVMFWKPFLIVSAVFVPWPIFQDYGAPHQ